MHLARVELQGFKSFADKTSFDLDRGITAVLGPNGCGKSNVVDAVKWVLGESSPKNLRGSAMADVIFAGSQGRRPLGMAEVTLYFNNDDGSLPIDYNEVSVTRRLYRSGESEYLINKQTCRKRDIRDLFLDTGIGTSAYSFIEQGRVEALLQAKPHERRLVFEEAAGISKYKQRRKETLSRLGRTNQYLFRVNDIVDEVDKNLRRVGRQAANAKRYQRLKSELDALKTVHATRLYREHADRLASLENELAEIRALQQSETQAQGVVGAELAQMTTREMQLAEQVDAQEATLREVQEELTQIQVELSASDERRKSLSHEKEESVERASLIRERLGAIDQEETQARENLEEAKTSASTLRENLTGQDEERLRLQTSLEEIESGVDALRKEMLSLSQQRNKLDSEQARIESQERNITERQEELTRTFAEIEAGESESSQGLTESNEKLQGIQEAEAGVQTEIARAKTLAGEHRHAAEKAGETIHTLTAERSGKESRRSTLEDLENSFAGAFAGVKAIMTAREEGHEDAQEIQGMVADLITVPQDVAVALETILGSSAQDIIVESARGGQRCIEYLKQRRAGRATFLPLDRIRPRRPLERKLSSLRGVVGEAIDLVEFDARFRPVMEYLLCGVLVVEDLSTARDLSGSDARGVRIVTLDGEVINPHGAMTGGRGKEQRSGMITRKAEKDALAEEIVRIEKDIAGAVDARNAAIACCDDVSAQVDTLESQLRDLQHGRQEIERAISIQEAEMRRWTKEREKFEAERVRLSDSLAELTTRKTPFGEQLATITQREAEIESALPCKLSEQTETRAALDALVDATAGLREKRAEAQSRVDELGRRIGILCNDRNDRKAELERCDAFLGRAGDEIQALEERLAILREREAEVLNRRDQMRSAGSGVREQLQETRAQLEERRSAERAIQRRLNEVHQALSNLQMRENETQLKMESVVEKAQEELQIDDLPARAAEAREKEAQLQQDEQPASAESLDEEDPDVFDPDNLNREELHERIVAPGALLLEFDHATLREMVTDTATKIDRIGPVNMCAIEELAELEARGEFLKAEQEDIQSAVDDLMAVVDRLNTECSKRFEETFNTVRENFKDMFRKLFNGGKADLILEDPGPDGDLLDAGIDIIARPPGKEPKSISLLSGGEKALSAVALLFAIFRSKPSPFCILDEVDGPLDESNINRFMETVRDFTDKTQFILISHSKSTMSMVDQIYGVTQQEPGVSTKISMRFNDTFNRADSTPPETTEELTTVAAG